MILGRTLGEGDGDKEDSGINDSSFVAEDEIKDSKDSEESREAASIEQDAKEDTSDCEKGIQDDSLEDVSEADKIGELDSRDEPAVISKSVPETAEKVNNKDESKENIKSEVPKEQRVNVPKKSVTEESKEVCVNIG